MKKVFFVVAFMLATSFSFAFISDAEDFREKESIENSKIADNKAEVEDYLLAACCTVSDGHYEVTYCDGNGNFRRACRKARKQFELEVEADRL